MSKSVAFGYVKHLRRVFCLIFENENHKMFEIIIYLPFAASLIFGVLLALDYTNNTRPPSPAGSAPPRLFTTHSRK